MSKTFVTVSVDMTDDELNRLVNKITQIAKETSRIKLVSVKGENDVNLGFDHYPSWAPSYPSQPITTTDPGIVWTWTSPSTSLNDYSQTLSNSTTISNSKTINDSEDIWSLLKQKSS